MSAPIDPEGRVAGALETAVDTYGAKVLSNPQMLSNLFKDLLPDAPRETNLLVTAAEAGVAGSLTRRIDQHIPPGAAASDVASDLSEQRAMDLGACQWVARLFAVALGHPVPPGGSGMTSPSPARARPRRAPAPPPAPPPGPPPAPGAPAWAPPAGRPPPGGSDRPPTAPWPGAPSPPGPAGARDRPARAGPAWTDPAGPPVAAGPRPAPGPGPGGPGAPPGGWTPARGGPAPGPAWAGRTPAWPERPRAGNAGPPGGWGGPTPPAGPTTGGFGSPRQRDRGPWIAGGVVVLVVIIAVIVLLVSGVFSGGSSKATPPASTTAAPTTAPGVPTTTGGARTLSSILPPDLHPSNSSSGCTKVVTPPTGFDTTHVIAELHCDGPSATNGDPGLPSGTLFAYQFDNAANLSTGLTQYNKAKDFTPSTATGTCPPANQNAEGRATWSNPSNTLSGEYECLYTSQPNSSVMMLTYIWTVTQANAIVEATGGSSEPAAAIQSWFQSENAPR